MRDSFAAIGPERRKRILDAAYKEFSRYGYKRASTNRIVAEAGIGKGPLFSYFGSKAGLFEFLVEHALDYLTEYMSEIYYPDKELDLVEKYRLAASLKLEASLKEPYIFDFIAWMYVHRDEIMEIDEVKSNFKKNIKKIDSMRNNFMSSMSISCELSKFRKDIPADKIVKYIGWVMDGYAEELVGRAKEFPPLSEMDLKPYWRESDEFFEDLKLLFYDR